MILFRFTIWQEEYKLDFFLLNHKTTNDINFIVYNMENRLLIKACGKSFFFFQ